ncbi:MAG: flagellar hook-basal body protein FliE [Rhizobiaceae bacterium]|nr:MAG: flagellar hook-basal body protein FliE [Rhizobiaceae bacterium]
MILPLNIVSNVGQADQAANPLALAASGANPTDIATSFTQALTNAVSKTADSLTNAQQMSIQALQGKGDTRQVVDAVLNAQQSLQTAIAIRDKIVSAYLDISRMSI